MASAESALPSRLTTPSLNLTSKPATPGFTPVSFSHNLSEASSTELKTFLPKFDAKSNNPIVIPLLLIYFKKLFNKLPTRSPESDWLPLSELPPSIESITEPSKSDLPLPPPRRLSNKPLDCAPLLIAPINIVAAIGNSFLMMLALTPVLF